MEPSSDRGLCRVRLPYDPYRCDGFVIVAGHALHRLAFDAISDFLDCRDIKGLGGQRVMDKAVGEAPDGLDVVLVGALERGDDGLGEEFGSRQAPRRRPGRSVVDGYRHHSEPPATPAGVPRHRIFPPLGGAVGEKILPAIRNESLRLTFYPRSTTMLR